MKRISLLILLAITAVNTCGAMANNAKINPALAASANKLQAKPILFFSIKDACGSRNVVTGELSGNSPFKSLELVDLEQNWWEDFQDYNKKSEKLTDHNQRQLLCDHQNSFNQSNGQLQADVYHKMNVIAEKIAKRLGAYLVIKYDGSGQNQNFAYIDPAYDITDEVFDTLNKEYKDSKGEKSACNHSCGIHCQHNSKNK